MRSTEEFHRWLAKQVFDIVEHGAAILTREEENSAIVTEQHAADHLKLVRAEGAAALAAGMAFADNSYSLLDPDYAHWARGWIEGQVAKGGTGGLI